MVMEVNMFENFTENAMRVMFGASLEALRLRHDSIKPEHIFLGVIFEKTNDATKELESNGVTTKNALEEIEKMIGRGNDSWSAGKRVYPNPAAIEVLELAHNKAKECRSGEISPSHIFLALINEKEIQKILENLGIDETKLNEIQSLLLGRMTFLDFSDTSREELSEWDWDSIHEHIAELKSEDTVEEALNKWLSS